MQEDTNGAPQADEVAETPTTVEVELEAETPGVVTPEGSVTEAPDATEEAVA